MATDPVPVVPVTSPFVVSKDTAYGALAGALVAIIVWATKAFAHVEIPTEIAVSLTVVVQTLVTHFVPATTGTPPGSP